MKKILIACIALHTISCVSIKKYNTLDEKFNVMQNDYHSAQAMLTSNQHLILGLYEKNDSLNDVLQKQTLRAELLEAKTKNQFQKLNECDARVEELKTNNQKLNKWVDDLTGASMTNSDIMKRTMDDLNTQQLKVLNLSLALQRYDSLQISSVKKTKRQLSDEKLKKSLEKVGFVFY